MQDCNISIANPLEILQSCNKLSIHGKQNSKHEMSEILKIKIEIHQHGLIYPTLWHAHSVTLVTAILTTCVNLYYKNRGSLSKLLMVSTFSLWPQGPVSLYILFGTISVKVQAISKGVTFFICCIGPNERANCCFIYNFTHLIYLIVRDAASKISMVKQAVQADSKENINVPHYVPLLGHGMRQHVMT